MRNVVRIAILALAGAWICAAQSYPAVSLWCEKGGVTVTINNGLSSTQKFQQSYPQCTVDVYLPGTTTHVSIYSNTTGTTLANPFTATTSGLATFYVTPGVYDIRLSSAGISAPFTIPSVTVPFSQYISGAKCDGTTNDSAAFQAAITAAISGATILIPPTTTGCVLATGVTISKVITLSSGDPSYPTVQLLAGANGITMITISGVTPVTIQGVGFNPNSHTGVTAVSAVNSTQVTLNGDSFINGFNPAVSINNSYFTMISNSKFRLNLSDISGFNNPNSTTLLNNTFFGGVPGSNVSVLMHNGTQFNIIGNTFECGAQMVAYNWYAAVITGNYFESILSTPCDDLSGVSYVNLGGGFGNTPVFGAVISGNMFNGDGGYGVRLGNTSGAQISGNYFGGASGAVIVGNDYSYTASIASCTNANPIVCTSAAMPQFYNLNPTVGLSGFTGAACTTLGVTNSWLCANGNFTGTQISSTTFSIPLDGTSFGSVTGTPTMVLYPVNKFQLGVNNYGSLSESQYISLAYGSGGTSADDRSVLQMQPIQLSGSMPTPTALQMATPGNAFLYWSSSIDGTNALWLTYKDSSGTIFNSRLSAEANVQEVGMAGVGGILSVQTPSLNSSYPSALNISGTYNTGTKLSTQIFDGFGVGSNGGFYSNMLFRTYTGTAITGSLRIDSGGGITASGGITAGAAAPTVGAGQVSYGNGVVVASNCGSLAGSAGCVVINVAGTTRYVPYY